MSMETNLVIGTMEDLFEQTDSIPNSTLIRCNDTCKFYIKDGDIISPLGDNKKPTSYKCNSCGTKLDLPEKYSAFVKCSYCGCIQDIYSLP